MLRVQHGFIGRSKLCLPPVYLTSFFLNVSSSWVTYVMKNESNFYVRFGTVCFALSTNVLPCHIHLPVCLWIMNLHNRAAKKNTSHVSEVLLQDTTHLVQRPCYQRGSPCQDPAGNRITRRPLDHRKEVQTAVVWSCLPFIKSGQNHLARHIETGKKTRQTEEEVWRQHQGMDRPGVRQVPEGSGEQCKMEETGCEIICGATTTLAVEG